MPTTPVSSKKTAAVTAPKTAPAEMSAARKAFWKSPYTNADAAAAKKAFKLPSLDAAKEFIGNCIMEKKESVLNAKDISRAKYDQGDCLAAFARSTYSEADAKTALKKMPFLSTLAEAKEYIGLKIVNKTENIMAEIGVTPNDYDSQDMMAAFKRSGFTDLDARAAKAKFDFLAKSPLSEVKEYLGLKFLNGDYGMKIMSDKGIKPGKTDKHERDQFSR